MAARVEDRRGPAGAAVAALVAAAASAPALLNGLFWDDGVVLSRQLPAMGTLGTIFFPPPGLPQWAPAYYRPLVFVSLLVDRTVWGSRIFGFHLTVLLLHSVSSGLVVWFVRAMMRGRGSEQGGSEAGRAETARLPARASGSVRRIAPRIAAAFSPREAGPLAAGLAFAVHPVHAEPVAWIMGRADVLCCLFVLLGLAAAAAWMRQAESAEERRGLSPAGKPNAGHPARRGERSAGAGHPILRAVLIALCSAAALLSKESAIVVPVLVGIVVWGIKKERTGPGERVAALGALAAAIGGLVAATGLRYAALGGSIRAAWKGTGLTASSGKIAEALVFDLRRLVVPWPIPDFHATIPSIDAVGIVGCLLFALLAAAAAFVSRSGRAAALFTGVCLVPTLAPVVTNVSLSPVADRYLYLPSVGVCWMFGVLVGALASPHGVFEASGHARWAPARSTEPAAPAVRARSLGRSLEAARKGGVGIFALVLLVAGVSNLRAVASYRNDISFWKAVGERSPQDPYVRMKNGQALGNAGRFADAEAELRIALNLDRGRGLRRAERTILFDNLGDLALRQERVEEARAWLEQAVATGPAFSLAHLHLARLHRTLALRAARDARGGDPVAEETRRAVEAVETSLALEPANAEALLLRADLALDLGDRAGAIGAIRRALSTMPPGPDRQRIERALHSLETRERSP